MSNNSAIEKRNERESLLETNHPDVVTIISKDKELVPTRIFKLISKNLVSFLLQNLYCKLVPDWRGEISRCNCS